MTITELRRRMDANKVKGGRALADKLGVNESTTSRWLNGKTVITIGMAALIRQHLPKLPTQ